MGRGPHGAAASAGLGADCTFTLCLPMSGDLAADFVEPVALPVSAASDTRLRVLIVDDNVDAAQTLAALLLLPRPENRRPITSLRWTGRSRGASRRHERPNAWGRRSGRARSAAPSHALVLTAYPGFWTAKRPDQGLISRNAARWP
jgi:hypothetical protein